MALDDLIAAVDTMEFEMGGWLQVCGARREEDRLHVTLGVFSPGVSPPQLWEVMARSVSSARLSLFDPFYEVGLTDDHPLVWPHTRDAVSLSFYFREGVADAPAVVADLYERHRDITGSWLPFEGLVDAPASTPLRRRIADRYGVLAEGPEPIITAYSEVLEQHGAKTGRFSCRPPARWDGETWVREPEGLSVCLLGESYIIAREFAVQRG